MLIIKKIVVGRLGTNCYLLYSKNNKNCFVIDPGDDAEFIIQTIEDLKLTPTKIIATHGHFDHILAAFSLQATYKIPFLINQKDQFLLERMQKSAKYFLGINTDPPPKINGNLNDKKIQKIGNNKLKIIHTPGHTPGSISIYSKPSNLLISGDLVFKNGGIGRTDFKYSKLNLLQNSIKKILILPEETRVYPGHGNDTTIISEKKNLNDYL